MTAPIETICHDGFRPGRLWSLWEMLKLDADLFYRAISTLQSGRYRIEGHLRGGADRKNDPLPIGDRQAAPDVLLGLKSDVLGMGARVTAMAIDVLIAEVANHTDEKPLTIGRFAEQVGVIDSRLEDELSLANLYVMDAEKAKYFDSPASHFGQEAADRIPLAIPDIEDAGKCIALNQGTASVFHSMRVMEGALKGLASLLGIPYAPSWESYISQIETCITEKHKRKTVKWKRDEPFYREILGNLQTIKIAWRNPTMHIVRRYSVEEAEEIYIAVRGFIKRLAPRLPKPKTTKKRTPASQGPFS